MRCELKTVRYTLTTLQRERETGDYRGIVTLFGRPHTAKSLLALDDRARDALKTLRDLRIPSGTPQFVLRVKPVFELVLKTAKVLYGLKTALVHTVPGEVREIVTKISGYEKAQQDLDFAEIHSQLGSTPRTWLKGGISIEKLFGEV